MRKIIKAIDSVSNASGHVVLVLCYGLIGVVVYSVFMRYVVNQPPMWTYDTSVMIGGAMYMLAWSYTQFHKGHVRVDVFYIHFSPRIKSIIDVLGTLIFFLPLFTMLIWTAYKYAYRAWATKERFLETYWYPPAAPIRTLVVIGLCLFLLQMLAQFVRDFYVMVKGKPYD